MRWTPGTMWAWSGTPSAWSGWTERRWSFPNGSSPSTTAPTPFRLGLERASPIRSSPTASAAPVCPTPPAWWGASVHTGWFEEPVWQPMPAARCATGISSAALWRGVEEKLDYLQSLGVETLYFCPIFEAAENHRYGTADYERVDPMLGSNEDFEDLCAAARARGIRVMLDGVFNHQGFVSRYFNGDGFYPELGAISPRLPLLPLVSLQPLAGSI